MTRDTEQSGQFEETVLQFDKTLRHTLWHDHETKNVWISAFCAISISLNKDCRVLEAMESLPPTAENFDKTDMLNALAQMGHYARSVRTTIADIDERLLPCLFIPDDEDKPPVVIFKSNENTPVFYNCTQAKILPIKKNRTEKIGTLWLFQPYDQHRQATSRFIRQGTGHSWFRALLGRFSTTFWHIVIVGLILNIVALGPPLYMMAVYDKIISPSDLDSLPAITGGVVIALLAEYALRRTRSRALSWLSARLDNIVGNRIFQHLLGLPPSLVERASVAAQIARIKTFESVRDLFSGPIFLSFLEAPYVILAVLIMAAIAGPLAAVPLLMLIAYGALFALMRHGIKSVIRLAAKSSSARQQFTLETFEKLPGIHANGLSKIWAKKYDDLSSREIVMNFQLAWLGTVAETCAQGLTLLSAVATVGFGVHLVWQGDISTGALIASMMLVWRILNPFYSLCAMIPRLEQLRNSIVQVNDLMELETETDATRTGARLPQLKGNIVFSNATLRYATENEPAIVESNLVIPAGGIIAVTGRNGSGKTSLLKMIKGMYTPQEGAVRVDGFDLRQLDPVYLRRHIAYVPQRPEFYSGTLQENIRLARPLATDSDIIHALKLADAWRDVSKMPDGLKALLSPETIPAGLAARLSLARGYLHGGSILLIDEMPGSLLNDRAGDYLRRYIEKSRGKRTIIFVSQNEYFQQIADGLIDLRKGEPPRYIPMNELQPDTLKETG